MERWSDGVADQSSLPPLRHKLVDFPQIAASSDSQPTMNASSFLPALLLAGSAAAADWPQFRGPQACGVDSAAPAPVRWNVEKNENVRWRAAIPGLGHSCPILWGDRVYVTTAVQPGKAELKVGLYGDIEPVAAEGPQQWRLLALDRSTGKVLWDKVAHEAMPRSQRHPKASHCNCTPATDGRCIVAILGSASAGSYSPRSAMRRPPLRGELPTRPCRVRSSAPGRELPPRRSPRSRLQPSSSPRR